MGLWGTLYNTDALPALFLVLVAVDAWRVESGVCLRGLTALWLDPADRPPQVPHLLPLDDPHLCVLHASCVPLVLHWPFFLNHVASPAGSALFCSCDFNGHWSLCAGCVLVWKSSQLKT